MTPAPPLLTLRNRTTEPLRLHFRCDGRPAWEAWAAPGGDLLVPAAAAHQLLASASYVDPGTHVIYTLAQQPVLPGTRLVAAVREVKRARSFGCEAEAGSPPHLLELNNQTVGAVCFALAFGGGARRLKSIARCGPAQRCNCSPTASTFRPRSAACRAPRCRWLIGPRWWKWWPRACTVSMHPVSSFLRGTRIPAPERRTLIEKES